MNTLGLAALFVSSVSFLAGCGCDPGNNSDRTPVAFTPTSAVATRTPSTCGVVDPAFSATDSFTLDLKTDAGTEISLNVLATAGVGEADPLDVALAPDQGSVTHAASNDGTINFAFTSGTDIAAIDDSPLDSVVVTLDAFPTADGQFFGAELRLSFEDGRVLDQAYIAPLSTVSYACN